MSFPLPRIWLATASLFAATVGRGDELPRAANPEELETIKGFRVDLLYTVPKEEQGSWVGMTHDPKGRLITADQYGGIYRITLPRASSRGPAQVEDLKITLPEGLPIDREKREDDAYRAGLVGAHGVLYAFDSLYLMVSENFSKQGIWRLRDTDGDDQFDEMKHLRVLEGLGEHGPHSLVLGPEADAIYLAAGNFTDLPAGLELTRPIRHGEDHLLPRLWDARGHARERYAPGGWVARMDPHGATMELFAQGFRNHFDLAFDANGELFTFDSDMEWDIGMPWYLPTRINHVVDAGDYGWRSGAGRWPDYYADSLPAVLDIGPASPTGTVFGTGAAFPPKYQRALFAADWTFGTLYAIHLQADGATFAGEKEEFVTGKPLPLTDVIVNPHDGALYFLVGGRRTQSALYRVTYVGEEDTGPARPERPARAAGRRRQLESLHAAGTGPEAIAQAWPHLGDSDRFIRWAARTAIERQLVANWADRALTEQEPMAAIEALIALARIAEPRYQPQLMDALMRIDYPLLPVEQQRYLLRAWQLAFTRMGSPPTDYRAVVRAHLEPHFPHADPFVNRLLVELLVYLDSPTVVAKTVPLLAVAEPTGMAAELLGSVALIARNDHYAQAINQATQSRPDRQQIFYAYILRHATRGWTTQLQESYFSWFSRTGDWSGGASFAGFLRHIRADALQNIPDENTRALMADLSKRPVHQFVPGAIAPVGPGQLYTVESAMAHMPAQLTNRDLARGEAMFSATACIACHRFGRQGGDMGPDLSGAGSRYSVRDLLENIIEPSKVVSDIYESERFELKNGNVLVGRIMDEEPGAFFVMTNPFAPEDLRRVSKEQIVSRNVHPTSFMPAGLINGLNPEELQDLIAYILSGEDPGHSAPRP